MADQEGRAAHVPELVDEVPGPPVAEVVNGHLARAREPGGLGGGLDALAVVVLPEEELAVLEAALERDPFERPHRELGERDRPSVAALVDVRGDDELRRAAPPMLAEPDRVDRRWAEARLVREDEARAHGHGLAGVAALLRPERECLEEGFDLLGREVDGLCALLAATRADHLAIEARPLRHVLLAHHVLLDQPRQEHVERALLFPEGVAFDLRKALALVVGHACAVHVHEVVVEEVDEAFGAPGHHFDGLDVANLRHVGEAHGEELVERQERVDSALAGLRSDGEGARVDEPGLLRSFDRIALLRRSLDAFLGLRVSESDGVISSGLFWRPERVRLDWAAHSSSISFV